MDDDLADQELQAFLEKVAAGGDGHEDPTDLFAATETAGGMPLQFLPAEPVSAPPN